MKTKKLFKIILFIFILLLVNIKLLNAFNYKGDYYVITALNSSNFTGKIIDENLSNISYMGYFSSNPNSTLTLNYDNTTGNITGNVNNLGKNTLFGIKFKNNVTSEEKTYFINFISTYDFSINATQSTTKNANDYIFSINDEERTNLINSRKIVNINSYNKSILFDSDGNFIFDIQKIGSNYYLNKRNKNFEILNSYSIIFKDFSDNIINNTTINSSLFKYIYIDGNNTINVIYNNELYSFIKDSNNNLKVDGYGNIILKSSGITEGSESTKLINGNLINNFNNGISGSKKSIQKGNFIYSLNGDNFSIYYLKGNEYINNNLEEIYNFNITTYGINDFYIIDNHIILYSKTNGLYYINGDYVIYILYDTNGNILEKTTKNIINYFYRNLLKKGNLTFNGDIGVISNTFKHNGGKNYNEDYIIDKELNLNLLVNNIGLNSYSETFKIEKYSSLNSLKVIDNNINLTGTIPIIGYGISLKNVKETDTCDETKNIQLNVPVTEVTKTYSIKDGYYCIYISPYDEGFNTSTRPFVVNGGNKIIVSNEDVVFGEHEIERNNLLDGIEQISFYIKSNKELSEMQVSFTDREGNDILKDLTQSGTGKIQLVSSLNGNYKYVFTTEVNELSETTKFTIKGTDFYGNKGFLIYQYDFYKGYYQVLGLTKTNDLIGVSDNINKTQAEKGFMYGLISGNNENKDNINTLFFFNKNKDSGKKSINIPTDSLGNIEFELLKMNIPDFKGKSKKDFNYNSGSTNYIFENGYYYYYDGDLIIDNKINYYGNGIILVKGKLKIKSNITKSISSQTDKYNNGLKIFTTKGIEIYPDVTKIDADLLTGDSDYSQNEKIITYTTINQNNVNSGLGGYIDTGGQFIFGISKFGDTF